MKSENYKSKNYMKIMPQKKKKLYMKFMGNNRWRRTIMYNFQIHAGIEHLNMLTMFPLGLSQK
jgi:hypothetical protein